MKRFFRRPFRKPFLGILVASLFAHGLLVWLYSLSPFSLLTPPPSNPLSIAIELAAQAPAPPALPPEPEPPKLRTPELPVLPMRAAEEPMQAESSPEAEESPTSATDFSPEAPEEKGSQGSQGLQGKEPRLPVSGILAVQAYLGRYALDGDPLGRGELWVEFPSPDRYRLRLWAKAEGWASIFVREPVVFESTGRIDDRGLRPEIYRQQTPFRGLSESHFDTEAGTAVLEKGQNPQPLPEDFQDRLSIIFQLSWLSQRNPESLRYGGMTEVKIAGRRRFFEGSFRAELPEDIVLPGGIVVTAVRLVSERMQSNREGQIEIWLDAADQNLPVRILFSEPSGRALDFLVIRDVFSASGVPDPANFNDQ